MGRGGPGRGRPARAARATLGPNIRPLQLRLQSRRNCPALAGYLVDLRAANLRQLRPNRADATYPDLRNLQSAKKWGLNLLKLFQKGFFFLLFKKKMGPP